MCLVGTGIIMVNYINGKIVINALSGITEYKPHTFHTKNPTLLIFLLLIEMLVYPNIPWMSLVCTTLMRNVLSIVLSREFNHCNSVLQNIIIEQTYSANFFTDIKKRFYKLSSMVEKVDDVFSSFVAINLVLSLGMLCGALYTPVKERIYLEGWLMPVGYSMLILLILLPPLANLNSKVIYFQVFKVKSAQ